jgi:hypothetical protein
LLSNDVTKPSPSGPTRRSDGEFSDLAENIVDTHNRALTKYGGITCEHCPPMTEIYEYKKVNIFIGAQADDRSRSQSMGAMGWRTVAVMEVSRADRKAGYADSILVERVRGTGMTMESDDWRPVEGFPGYSVNPLGQVVRNSTGRLLVPRYNQDGVAYVGLMRDWQQCIVVLCLVWWLVAFLPSSSEIFDTPIQLDGDPTNCRVDNLMWRPDQYAVKYKQQFKERYDFPIEAPVQAVNGERFPNSLAAACRYGLLEREVVLSITQSDTSLAHLSVLQTRDDGLGLVMESERW